MTRERRPGHVPISHAYRALRHRDFRLFWTAALISNVGMWVQNTAVPYVVYDLTRSKALLGVAAFLQMAPTVVVFPYAGALADRMDRRRLLLLTQSAMAALALGLCAAWAIGARSTMTLLVVITASGIVGGLNVPAWQAFVPSLVPREDLLNAVTLNSAQFNAARAIGPALAGVVLATLGATHAFLLNGLSFGAVIVALVLIRQPRIERQGTAPRLLREFTEGARYVRSTPEVFGCIALVPLISGLCLPVFQLVPVFATDVFEVGESGYGILAAAWGAGATAAVIPLGMWAGGVARRRLLPAGLALMGLSLLLFASAPSFPIAVAALGLAGMAFLAVASTLQTTVQELVPDELRGRVMAIYAMVFTAAFPTGALLQGWGAEALSARVTVGLAATAVLAVAAVLVSTGWFARFDRALTPSRPTAILGR